MSATSSGVVVVTSCTMGLGDGSICKCQHSICHSMSPSESWNSHLLWGERWVEDKADGVQRAVLHFIAVRQAIYAAALQLHEHVVPRLQSMRERMRVLPPALIVVPAHLLQSNKLWKVSGLSYGPHTDALEQGVSSRVCKELA